MRGARLQAAFAAVGLALGGAASCATTPEGGETPPVMELRLEQAGERLRLDHQCLLSLVEPGRATRLLRVPGAACVPLLARAADPATADSFKAQPCAADAGTPAFEVVLSDGTSFGGGLCAAAGTPAALLTARFQSLREAWLAGLREKGQVPPWECEPARCVPDGGTLDAPASCDDGRVLEGAGGQCLRQGDGRCVWEACVLGAAKK